MPILINCDVNNPIIVQSFETSSTVELKEVLDV